MTVRLIFAQSANGFIGKDNELLFRLPEDMAVFKEKTQGSTVVMGRKTWMSIPKKFRPLPGRRNVVLTSSTDTDAFEGAHVYRELKQAIADFSGEGPIWIIGGERLYNEGLNFADEIHETLVHQAFEGDARAPTIDHHRWTRVSSSPEKSHEGLLYQFNIYVRKDHDEAIRQEASGQEGREETCYPIDTGDNGVSICAGQQAREGLVQGSISFGSAERRTVLVHAEGSVACDGQCGQDDQARCARGAAVQGLEAR